jgi:pilus assembly protein CpaF
MHPTEIYKQSTRYFLGPVLSLLDDDDVSEVMINGPTTVYFEKKGLIHRADAAVCFPDEESLLAAARNIAEFAHRRIDGHNHSMDARLPDGSRVHVIIPPAAKNGVTITIRKFKAATFSLAQLIKWGSVSDEMAEFLELCVLLHKNIVVAGGTGTGKTSLLNALSAAIPEHERIIVIEDTSELRLHQAHTVYLEAQPPAPDGHGQVTIRDLFVDSLRMRPDRIIVGEVRRGEALDLIQSMLSGHSGSISTVHANTPRDALIRLETLCLMSDAELPQAVARMQVASAIDVIVQLTRFSDGSRRVSAIAEALRTDDQTLATRTLYEFRSSGKNEGGAITGTHVRTEEPVTFADEPATMGFGERVGKTAGLFLSSGESQR